MPDFGVALAWMILAPIAVIFDILAILIIQHYRPFYHSTDVALLSLLFIAAMASYFIIPIPAVLELAGWDWNHESCNFYTWLSTTLRFSHLLGILILNVYWVSSIRTKSRQGHMFMSSFFMKISVGISWFVSVIVGLAPVTGGTRLFGFYSASSCHFLPTSISIGFGVLLIVVGLSCVAMGIISSADTLTLFRNMKNIALTKYNSGRFHNPGPSVSGVARSSSATSHARHSELSVAADLCRLAMCLAIVSSCLNILPFVVMQFLLLFEDTHRDTFEDVTLWVQLVDALLLPHLMWILSTRYRHAFVYAWKVHILRDSSAKEDDASACTLQSYKMRAIEQQQQHQHHLQARTLNGMRKIQANGVATSSSALDQTTTRISGTRRPSGNKICPIEQRSNGSVEGQGRMLSSPSESYSVTDLDDGMTVLSTFPQQTAAEITNGVVEVNAVSGRSPPVPNGTGNHIEGYSNGHGFKPLSNIKPQRKRAVNSPAQGHKVAFGDFSEASSGHNSPQIPASSVSSPAKSLLDTPKREVDVKRTASACSRREWKEKMRKKHLPAIFVNNSLEDEKEEKLPSNSEEQIEVSHNIDSTDGTEMYEMKESAETPFDEIKVDAKTTIDHKQQSFSDDNFYVSGEFHYNYLSDSFPRKLSLKTQSTVDSDGVCDMYESDDIGTILDTSMVSDSIIHHGAPVHDKVTEFDSCDDIQDVAERHDFKQIESVCSTEVTNLTSSSGDVDMFDSEIQGNENEIDLVAVNTHSIKNEHRTSYVVKSSLEEFEENERKILSNDNISSDMEIDRPVSRLKLIDLEANNNKELNVITVNEDMTSAITVHNNNTEIDKEKNTADLQGVSQDYDDLETVSGLELLKLKRHAVTTVRTAHEITFDSSSDDGGIENEAFEGDGDDSRDVEELAENPILPGQHFGGSSFGASEMVEDRNSDDVTSQDMIERYVTGKEDSEESGSNKENDQDSYESMNLVNEKDSGFNHKHTNIERTEHDGRVKRDDFKTNPFLRESFEVLVQSPEYQQKINSPDNPFFITVKPLALPRQKSLESPRTNTPTSSDHSVLAVKENEEIKHVNISSKPPLPTRPPASTSLAAKIKPRHLNSTGNDLYATKPPVPIRKPHQLRKQNSLDNVTPGLERNEQLGRPRTSSEDELEKIFDKDTSIALQENPFFPGEDPSSSTIIAEEDPNSTVFYSMAEGEEIRYNKSHKVSNDMQTFNSDDSIVIEPYGQRRPPWLDESLEFVNDSDNNKSLQNISPIISQHPPNITLNSNTLKSDGHVEEYDFDSVRIQGVSETQNGLINNNGRIANSNSGSSIFYSSSGSDRSSIKITPVSEEETPTFQFYQFDDDIEKGFEDALSVDYLTHTNVYSGFGLCFESIKEEPEDSLSESTSSFDGLGESGASTLFKTQAIISRPSSRASVNSSPNLDASGLNVNGFSSSDNSKSNDSLHHTHSGGDQGYFNFGEMDTVNYEKFASVGNETFITSERTSGDGREEIIVHSNGSSSASHSHPGFHQSFAQDVTKKPDDAIKETLDPWAVGLSNYNDDEGNTNSSHLNKISSPWLEVKNVDLDMSFESDFSQQNENSVINKESTEDNDSDSKLKSKNSVDEDFESSNVSKYNGKGEQVLSDFPKAKDRAESKPITQTIHYKPVYF